MMSSLMKSLLSVDTFGNISCMSFAMRKLRISQAFRGTGAKGARGTTLFCHLGPPLNRIYNTDKSRFLQDVTTKIRYQSDWNKLNTKQFCVELQKD